MFETNSAARVVALGSASTGRLRHPEDLWMAQTSPPAEGSEQSTDELCPGLVRPSPCRTARAVESVHFRSGKSSAFPGSHCTPCLSVHQGVDVMKRLVFALAALLLHLAAAAQEATLNGTVTDSTGSVLPGVTVQALHEASGNTFMAVTDGRGAFQIPVRVGDLQDHGPTSGIHDRHAERVEVLVGQTATVNLQMSPSSWRRRSR